MHGSAANHVHWTKALQTFLHFYCLLLNASIKS